MGKKPARYPVSCEVDGTTYRGTYWVEGKTLTVSIGKRANTKTAQVGFILPELLPAQLLQKLVKEGKA
jgi:hypothetical protein